MQKSGGLLYICKNALLYSINRLSYLKVLEIVGWKWQQTVKEE